MVDVEESRVVHTRTHTRARARAYLCSRVYMPNIHICVCTREKGRKRATIRGGGGTGRRGLREARREREWKKEGGQVTPPRAAVAAGEITAPSLLARDVHKLCITPSGAHVNYARPPRALYVRAVDRSGGRERGATRKRRCHREVGRRGRRLSLERVTRVRIPVMTVKARDRLKGDIPFQRWVSDSRSRSFA